MSHPGVGSMASWEKSAERTGNELGNACSIAILGYQEGTGKRLHNYGKSPSFMGKPTISMAMFNSYVSLPEGKG